MSFKEPDKIDQNYPQIKAHMRPLDGGIFDYQALFHIFIFWLLLSHACYCLVLSKNLGMWVLD